MFKIYLAKRVELMRYRRNAVKNDVILYETIFKECQVGDWTTLNKTEKKRKRETIAKILEDWVKKEYIKNFAVTTSGKTQTGVKISLK